MLAHEIVTLGPIKVVGPAIITSNEKEMTKEGQMVELYEYFVHNNVSEWITNKKDNSLVVLYTDYDSDESGEYVYAIGHQVLTDECHDKLEFFETPSAKYLHFTSERGYLNDVLPSLWREIWRRTQSGELGAERAFTTDFEFHNYEDNKSADVVVDVFLSIR